jgi:hypothetical protein
LAGTGLLAGCLGSDPSSSSADVRSTSDPIQGGQLETGFPAVGMVALANSFCTGTLIAPSYVLTAKHCGGAGMVFKTGTSEANFVSHDVDSQLAHPTLDLLLVHLTTPISDIDGMGFNEDSVPGVGQVCVAVGFGQHEESSGTKRSATEEVTSASTSQVVVQMVSGIADHGDSGGPLLCNDRIAAVVFNHTDGDWPQHTVENYTTIDPSWIRSNAKVSPVDDDPAVTTVSWEPNRLDTFKRGANGEVFHKRWDGVGWAPSNLGWESLGGATVGTPEVVSWGPNRLDVFVRDSALSIAHKWWDGLGWGPSNAGYEFLGAPSGATFTSHPSAVSWGINRLDVFAVGSDGLLYHKSFNGAGWSPSNTGWESLGGGLSGPVKAVSWEANRLDVFAAGTDRVLRHKWFTPAGWAPSSTGWESLGGTVSGTPDVVTQQPNSLDVFIRNASNGAVFHKSWDGVGWRPSTTGYEDLGGAIDGSPRVVSWDVNRLDVFVRMADGALHHKWFDGLGWSPSNAAFENLGGLQVGSPSAVTWGVNRIDVFTERTDTGVNHDAFSAAGWTGFESLGVP